MTRLLDSLASTLAGMILGILLVAAIAPGAWVPTSSSGQHSGLPSPSGSLTDDPPSSDVAGRSRTPQRAPAAATELSAVAAVSPMPAVDEASARTAAATLSGWATWFRSPSGVSAAGPALRAALGPGWRGTVVTVTANGRLTTTKLGDWCQCADRHGRPTLIDLDRVSFAALAEPSRGVIAVTVRRALLTPPPTSTGDAP